MATARAERRGAVSVLAALLMVFLLTVVAFATELGWILVVRTQLQSAADSAALAAAASLRDGNAVAAQSADSYGESNKAGGAAASVDAGDVEMGHWSDDGVWTPQAQAGSKKINAVRVTVQMTTSKGNPLGLNLARMFGMTHVDLSATATARVKPPPCSKIIGLDRIGMSGWAKTDSYDSTLGAYSAGSAGSNGTVCTNGPVIMGGFTEIHGDAHHGPGMAAGGGTITGSVEPLDEPLVLAPVDLGNVATINDNNLIPLTNNGRNPLTPTNQFLLFPALPGLPADSVTLPPGKYYFTQVTLGAGSTLNITGTTEIYVTGIFNSQGNAVVNSTQNPSDLQLYSTGPIVSMNGYAAFYGIVYAPNASVTVAAGAGGGYYGAVTGKVLGLAGLGGVHADESINQLNGVRYQSVLVE